MKRFAQYILKLRLLIVTLFTAVTVFLAYQMFSGLTVGTNFAELLPQSHDYVKLHKEFRDKFGGANFLVIMVKVKDGTIFNKETLKKIKFITLDLERVPGIDRYKIVSIASLKLKVTEVSTFGFKSEPLMYPDVPQTEAEMQALKNNIYSSEALYGKYVSHDCKKAMIYADFFEERMDYNVVYKYLVDLRAQIEDENTSLHIIGHPMHLGTVASMTNTMNYVMAGTLLLIGLLIYLSYRSLFGMVIIVGSGAVSLVWGLGFMAIMGYNLDPLIFVMPFLIALMAFRHSHQLYNRFYEEYLQHQDRRKAAETIIERMFLPGFTSVITDAFGIAIIAITPIPLLKNIAMACAFSSIVTVLVGLILTPVLLTYVPASSRFLAHITKEKKKDELRRGLANRFADWLGPWLIGRGQKRIGIVVILVLIFSFYWSEQMIIGDAEVGSNLLWPDSRYNKDAQVINRHLPLISPLYITVIGEERKDIQDYDVLIDIERFTRYMNLNSGAVGASSIASIVKVMGQKMHQNDPKWLGFPDTKREAWVYFGKATGAGDPGDMDKYIDYYNQFSSIWFYYKDKTGPTIVRAIEAAKEYVAKHARLPDGVRYKLAAGVIGVEAAINEVVAAKQLQTLLVALAGVFVFCSLNFRSLKAGLILMLPLVLSNFLAFAYMAVNQIGLSISTLPVSAAGIGMGVDYGIYLVARLAEERRKNPDGTLEEALIRTIQTYGKSIIYIAGTLVVGLLVWTISPLKFQAQMGMMLAVILFLNCLGAIFLVPVLVLWLKPRFVAGNAKR